VTHHAKFIAVGITEISAIVILMVVRPQARWPLAFSSQFQRFLVTPSDLIAALGLKCEHLSVPRAMKLTIESVANDKEWTGSIVRMPARPRLAGVTKSALVAEDIHDGAVKTYRSFEIPYANENMRKHIHLQVAVGKNFPFFRIPCSTERIIAKAGRPDELPHGAASLCCHSQRIFQPVVAPKHLFRYQKRGRTK